MEFRKSNENKKGYITDYIIMEGIQDNLKWTRFGGVDQNGRQTSRTFNVQIDEDMIPFFQDEKIKVGEWTPKNAEDPNSQIVYTVAVTVDMDHQDWYPCDIYLTGPTGRIKMKKENLGELDQLAFSKVDVKCRKKRNAKDPSMFVLYLSTAFFDEAVDDFMTEHMLPDEKPADDFGMNAPEEVPFA